MSNEIDSSMLGVELPQIRASPSRSGSLSAAGKIIATITVIGFLIISLPFVFCLTGLFTASIFGRAGESFGMIFGIIGIGLAIFVASIIIKNINN